MKADSFGIYREKRNIQGVAVEFRGGCSGPFQKKFGAFIPGTCKRLIPHDYVISIEDEEDEGGLKSAFENHVVRPFSLDYGAKLIRRERN